MKILRIITVVFILFVLSIYLTGCGNKFFDPTQVGRFRPVPAVNVILNSLGVAEEEPSTWELAEDPKPIDVISYETDYVFGAGDYVRISIFELLREGLPDVRDYIITETGKVSIPEVGDVKVAGLTESQLEEEIKDILSPSIIKEPSVTVSLLSSQRRNFSIQGNGVPRANRYPIPRYDFRLREALAIAGGVDEYNISYIYVSRSVTGQEALTESVEPEVAEPVVEPEQQYKPEKEMLEIIAPLARRRIKNNLVITSSEMVTDKELAEIASPEGFEEDSDHKGSTQENEVKTSSRAKSRETIDEPIGEQPGKRIEWIFRDGKWIPVQIDQEIPQEQAAPLKIKEPQVPEPLEEKAPEDFAWEQIETGGVQTRLIKIPTDKLFGGDYRYNIVIRPGDSIHVPLDVIGEFSIMGNVNRTGYVNITGRPMNLKQAISAAGGLGPLAWPKNCEVVRRIGKNKEEIVLVDLDKIFRGEQPDFFIKPNDLINVGTHPTARWRAVLRNAFRATYGFGFIYDRNFGDRDFGTSRPIPDIF